MPSSSSCDTGKYICDFAHTAAPHASADTAVLLALLLLLFCSAAMLAQVARGRAIIPANKRHLELEPTIVGKQTCPWSHAYLLLMWNAANNRQELHMAIDGCLCCCWFYATVHRSLLVLVASNVTALTEDVLVI